MSGYGKRNSKPLKTKEKKRQMKRLFGQDSALFRFLQILMNLAIMNVLFLLTSIPVITMGAAYTALLSCVFDLLMEEGEFSAKFYYKNFRKSH